MSFHVGQRVVCVDDASRPGLLWSIGKAWGDLDGLRKGTIYTVRGIELAPIGVLTLKLREIVRKSPPGTGNLDAGFAAFRFRPVVETDISIFTAMLNPVPKREGVDA